MFYFLKFIKQTSLVFILTVFHLFSVIGCDNIQTKKEKNAKEKNDENIGVHYIFCNIVNIRYKRKTPCQLYFCLLTVGIVREEEEDPVYFLVLVKIEQ